VVIDRGEIRALDCVDVKVTYRAKRHRLLRPVALSGSEDVDLLITQSGARVTNIHLQNIDYTRRTNE